MERGSVKSVVANTTVSAETLRSGESIAPSGGLLDQHENRMVSSLLVTLDRML